LIFDTAIAVVPIPGELTVTVGDNTYPEPPFVTLINPTIPLAISTVAVVPDTPPPIN
jgi:hypothetical protein